MSLYNTLFGYNPFMQILLAVLGVDYRDIPRFRDSYLSSDMDIVIMTRTGGGNRGDYKEENEKLRQLPGFKFDEDMQLDCTFALFHYAIPEEYKDFIASFKEEMTMDPEQKWKDLFAKMNQGGNSG